MPHDRCAFPLKAGDEVTLRCRVVSIFDTSDGFRDCNVNLQAINATGDDLYTPFITCNSRLVDLMAPGSGVPRDAEDDKLIAVSTPFSG